MNNYNDQQKNIIKDIEELNECVKAVQKQEFYKLCQTVFDATPELRNISWIQMSPWYDYEGYDAFRILYDISFSKNDNMINVPHVFDNDSWKIDAVEKNEAIKFFENYINENLDFIRWLYGDGYFVCFFLADNYEIKEIVLPYDLKK
jgi:hypothetical protein